MLTEAQTHARPQSCRGAGSTYECRTGWPSASCHRSIAVATRVPAKRNKRLTQTSPLNRVVYTVKRLLQPSVRNGAKGGVSEWRKRLKEHLKYRPFVSRCKEGQHTLSCDQNSVTPLGQGWNPMGMVRSGGLWGPLHPGVGGAPGCRNWPVTARVVDRPPPWPDELRLVQLDV